MIEYRRIQDIEILKQFCAENGLPVPLLGEATFGAFENEKLIGYSTLKRVYRIEFHLLEHYSPRISQILLEKILAVASFATKSVSVLLSKEIKEKWLSPLENYGFIKDYDDVTVLNKEI
jgi:hypothetical protein